MFGWKFILFSQFPALFLLSLISLIAFLRVRKLSAVRSLLWILLFGVSFAASLTFLFLGIQAAFWSWKTLLTFSVWGWIGIGVIVILIVLRIAHIAEKARTRRMLDRERRRAEQDKEDAIAAAREEGAAIARAEAEAAARAAEAQAAAAEAQETPETPAENID